MPSLATFECNGFPDITIEAAKGDMVLFDSRLIPFSFNLWPYEAGSSLQISFDGACLVTPTHWPADVHPSL